MFICEGFIKRLRSACVVVCNACQNQIPGRAMASRPKVHAKPKELLQAWILWCLAC
jgi:hypothetical protein